MRRLFTFLTVFSFVATSSAIADYGGVKCLKHGNEASVPLNVRIGDVAEVGMSLIGVARNGGSGMLICISHIDTACFAICSEWMGGTSDRVAYSPLDDRKDSLILYSYTIGMSESDDIRRDSHILVGMDLTNRYVTPFSLSPGRRESYKEYTLYGKRLNKTEQRKVESYYAVKHGLTLDQQEPNDYTNSNGDVVWNGTENRAYRYDIAGIGADSGSKLSHLTASGINTNHTPEIRALKGVKDGMYLMMSHNGEAMQFGEKDADSNQTLGRIWKTCATGNWSQAPVSMSFSVGGDSGLPKLKANETYVLRVGDTEESIHDEINSVQYRCRYADGEEIVFDDVDMSKSRSYFTVASVPLTEQEESNPIQYVNVTPNPTSSGDVCIEVGLYREAAADITIYNLIGQTIARGEFSGEAYYRYNGFLPVQGTYVAVVTSGDDRSVHKIIRR